MKMTLNVCYLISSFSIKKTFIFHMSEVIDFETLKKITKKIRPSAQRRALLFMGIPFKVRADGSLFVSNDGAFGGKVIPMKPK